MSYQRLAKAERQKDRKAETLEVKKMMNRTQKTSRQPRMTNSDRKRRMGRGGWVAMSSRFFELSDL